MTTAQLIEQHKQQLLEAEQLTAVLNAEWEAQARAGKPCEDIEDRQESTAKLCKRLELRLEQLHLEAEAETEAERISQAAALRDQIIAKYQGAAKHYTAIKAQATKLQRELETFNRAVAELSEVDVRRLKALGGQQLPRDVSQILTHEGFDARDFDIAWRDAHHLARHGLEQAAYLLR
jgi:hypothetical protein